MSSSTPTKTSGGTSHILPAERKKGSFDAAKLEEILHGGPEATKHLKEWVALYENVPIFDKSNDAFMSRAETVKKSIDRFFESYKIVRKQRELLENHSPVHGKYKIAITPLSGNAGGFTDHFGLFLGTLVMQASPEQQKEWVRRAMNLEIVGTYAQTELGHGSNVRGLETTATYDEATDEFIVDSPTLTSMKWWPGALGLLATHAIVYARLFISGKDYGYHAFMVQLRAADHTLLPGVETGDLGPKMGYNYYDSGYLSLDKVRIPREYMLMRFQRVEKGGKYTGTPKGLEKIAYMTMTKTRVMIARGSGHELSKAVTIAVRYNAVRHQGFLDSKKGVVGGERATIDYRIQQHRLFPELAASYAMHFATDRLKNLMERVDASITSKDAAVDPEAVTALHVTSAGLKAFTTVMSCEGMEEVRRCCGGQGYTMSSGIASLLLNHLPSITYEGDLVPMALQVSRFLVRCYGDMRRGGKLKGGSDNSAAYLYVGRNTNLPKDLKQMRDPAILVEVWNTVARRAVTNAAMALFAASKKKGISKEDAWNSCHVLLFRAAQAHTLTTIVKAFADALPTVQDRPIRDALTRLFVVFALSRLDRLSVAETCLTQANSLAINTVLSQLYDEIRPDAIVLTDAFGHTDRQLCNSCIGRFDGNVYEALVDWTRRSPLNHDKELQQYIAKRLEPFLDQEYLKKGTKAVPKL
eukprot:PhM_4_TR10727/c0_g1_i1/m.13070/K00232/E1.3.3.6, ACOX1, ACOX3; acyl-CoA oxidase